MCMQDLAISARITWRPVPNLRDAGVASWTVIPTNPLRVAITVCDTGGSPRSLSFTPANAGPFLGVTRDLTTGGNFATGTVTVLEYPGVFNIDLFVNLPLAGIRVWEGIMDSDLSKSVQAENVIISSNGG